MEIVIDAAVVGPAAGVARFLTVPSAEAPTDARCFAVPVPRAVLAESIDASFDGAPHRPLAAG